VQQRGTRLHRRVISALNWSVMMKQGLAIFLIGTFLLISAHRLPAPISEIPESPTPPAAPTSTPQPTPPSQPSTTPERADAARFAGTWTGKIKIGNGSESNVTLVVNREATALTQILKGPNERVRQTTHPTTFGGQRLSWRSGQMENVVWTVTPNPDGQTALATTKMGAAGIENTATFQRAPSSAEPTRKHPGMGAKRDPGN
jgi:hypothetical protein